MSLFKTYNRIPLYDFKNDENIKSFSDCIPFIDYIQLSCSKVPLSFFRCVEDVQNRFRFLHNRKWIPYTLPNKMGNREVNTDKTITFLLSNKVFFQFYGFKWFKDSYSNYASLRVFIPARSIPNSSLENQIKFIKSIACSIRLADQYHIADRRELPTIPDFLVPEVFLISQMDISLNLKYDTYYEGGELVRDFNYDVSNFEFDSKANWRHHGVGNTPTGISIGNPKKGIGLTMYDKIYDPANNSNLSKFDYSVGDDFVRLEYRISRYIIKNFYKYKKDYLGQLSDLSTHFIISIWKYCLNNKRVIPNLIDDVDLPRNKLINRKKIALNDVRRYLLIRGLVRKYELDEESRYMIDSIEDFFLNVVNLDPETINNSKSIAYR